MQKGWNFSQIPGSNVSFIAASRKYLRGMFLEANNNNDDYEDNGDDRCMLTI